MKITIMTRLLIVLTGVDDDDEGGGGGDQGMFASADEILKTDMITWDIISASPELILNDIVDTAS